MLFIPVLLKMLGGSKLLKFVAFVALAPNLYTLGQDKPNTDDCLRTCVRGDTRTCRYKLVQEFYTVLTAACGACAQGRQSDCSLPQCVAADGVERTIYTYNRELPGHPINVCVNDTIVVELDVLLIGHGESVHWHGFTQRTTPWMDGVVMVTQCPVYSGQRFIYSFPAPDPGTFFYHSHAGIHKVNGAIGGLVVRQPKQEDVQQSLYDEDLAAHTILLLDWQHVDAEYVFPGLAGPPGQEATTILINGKGQFMFPNGTQTRTPLAQFNVQPGKRYRFRLINAGVFSCPLGFQIEGHTMLIIASDGKNIKPQRVDTLVSFSGERYDFILERQQGFGQTFWIHTFNTGFCRQTNRYADQVAVVRYVTNRMEDSESKNKNVLPTSPRPESKEIKYSTQTVLNDPVMGCDAPGSICVAQLQSADPPDPRLQGQPAQTLFLGINFHNFTVDELFRRGTYEPYIRIDPQYLGGQINNISFIEPGAPLLTQPGEAETCSTCATAHCACPHVIKLPLNTLVEFILVDTSEDPTTPIPVHPMHLHGYWYAVTGMGTLPFTMNGWDRMSIARRLASSGRLHSNNPSPPIKDTVMLPAAGYVILRFFTDNPGTWFFHCHFQYHMASGMMAVIQVGEPADYVPPPANFPRCENYPINPAYIRDKKPKLT